MKYFIPAGGAGSQCARGLGIQLVQHYLDGIRYRREAGENILRLHHRLA